MIIGVGVFLFSVLAFAVMGICRKKWKQSQDDNQDVIAHRNVGFFLSTLSLSITLAGGLFINRTTALVYEEGLAHTLPPWTYASSLIIGAFIFVKNIRKEEYITMVDPLQEQYGSIMGACLSIPALFSDILWCAALLSFFASVACSMVECNYSYVVVACLAVVTFYTLTGGLYGVLYTHILYIFFILTALWLVVPFALIHPHVDLISSMNLNWSGVIRITDIGRWSDQALLLIFGGIPRQVYFQHVLSSKSPQYARIVSFGAAVSVVIISLPPVIIGMTGKSTNWLSVLPENSTLVTGTGAIINTEQVFTMVMKYLTPYWVSIIALGGHCAATLSSADSALLSTSSILSHNVYKTLIRRKASSTEVSWVYRACVLFSALLSGTLACFVTSLTDLWIFSYDLVYVILFPQFLGATLLNLGNIYGSIVALITALVLRLSGGDERIGLPITVEYPYFDKVQLFPFRTFAMIMSFLALIIVSSLADWWRPARKSTIPPEDVSVLKLSYKEPSYVTPSHSFAHIDHRSQNCSADTSEEAKILKTEDSGFGMVSSN